MLTYFAIILLRMLLNVYAEDVQVCIQQMGCVKGITMKGIDGEELFEAFLGIPYAKPPIGILRLKNPEPVEPWSPKVLEATTKREDCLQKNYLYPGFLIWGLEDCLYLNIYRPKLPTLKLLPIIFYIHGGGLFSGGANPQYLGPEYFMAHKDVILVTFYYRLGPLGFLSTNDTNMPGNFGLKDQNMALRWVQHHIAAFGGDAQLVTIMGHSAGASSAHYHMLSPASAGLFQRAVLISGTSLSSYAAPLDNPEMQVRAVAEAAGIENVHKYCTKSLTKALQDMDANTLLMAGDSFKILHNLPLVNYRPVVEQADWDNAFITERPVDTMRRGDYSIVPTMLGTLSSKGEGSAFALGITESEALTSQFNEHFDDNLRKVLDIPTTKSTADEMQKDMQLLVDEYMRGVHEINDDTAIGFNELFGDINYLYPLYEYLQLSTEQQHPTTYVYRFNYRGQYSLAQMYAGRYVDYGAVHCDDYLYLFNSPIVFPVLQNITAGTMHFINAYVREIVEFATTGKPPSFEQVGVCTADSFKASVANGQGICNYLEFANEGADGGHKTIVSNDYNIKRMQLLAQIIGKS